MSNGASVKRQAPQWDVARRFFQAITGKKNPPITFQTFDDKGEDKDLAGWRHGTLADCSKWLVRKMSAGCGVYFAVNRCDGNGRKRGNVIQCDAVAVDFDGTDLPKSWAIAPDIIVESSPGRFHAYWLIEPTTDLNAWSDTQARFAKYYGGDPKIFDPPRVLRVPGFDHLKGDAFRVRVLQWPDKESLAFGRRTLQELADAHPCDYVSPRERDGNDGNRAPIGELDTAEAIDKGRDYLEGAPVSVEGDGGNNNTFNVFCRLIDFGLSAEMSVELATEGDDSWNARCLPPWDEDELTRIANNAAKYRHDPPGIESTEAVKDDFDEDEDDEEDDKPKKPKFKKRNGKPIANASNVAIAVATLGVSFRYDKFADRYMIDGLADFGPYFDDAAERRIRLTISEKFGFAPTKELVFDVCFDMAQRNAFDPVCDYLDNAESTWDGKPRIDRFLIDYAGADDSPYVREVSRLLFIAVVRRNRQPGAKFDELPIFESRQGLDKSTALAILALNEDWFSDSFPLNADNRATLEHAQGKILIEIAELQGMRRAETEHVKAMLSRTTDRGRMAYARTQIEAARRFIFVGTSNSSTYLQDITGNRRFWPVKVRPFDLRKHRADVHALWGEAATRERAGESIRMNEIVWGDAAIEQDKRLAAHDDPFKDVLQNHLNGLEGRIESESVWRLLDMDNVGRRTPEQNRRLGLTMRALGWKRGTIKLGPGRNARRVAAYSKGTSARVIRVCQDTGFKWVVDPQEDRADAAE